MQPVLVSWPLSWSGRQAVTAVLPARPRHTPSPSILPLRRCDDRRGRWIAGRPSYQDACLPSNEEQLLNVSPLRPRTSQADEACAEAVDLARSAAEEVAGAELVGEHLGVEPDGDRVCTHLFACLDPAYTGWRWAVTIARASRSRTVTVSESLLLPGPDSLLAPDWVPWRDRVRPGDLGVGDLLPAHPDDERLVPAAVLEGADGVLDWDDSPAWAQELEPAVTAADDAEVLPPSGEGATAVDAARRDFDLAPGPARVLSAIGRDETALRWY